MSNSRLRNTITPSQKEGLSVNDEVMLRAFGAELIAEFGILLKVPQVTIATGQVLMHRFYFRQSFYKYNVKNIAMACIFLASKVEESPRRLRDIVNVCYRSLSRRQGRPNAKPLNMSLDQLFWELRTAILEHEQAVLRELGFHVRIIHPHQYILSYLSVLGGDQQMAQSSWNTINDVLRTTACVLYKPEHIAVTAIFMASRQLAHPLPEGPPDPWWELFDTTTEHMVPICRAVTRLYELGVVREIILEKSSTAASPATNSAATN